MNLWRNHFAKLVVWLLAGIVPAQPVLALDCACSCHANPEAACCTSQSEAACDAHDDDSSHGCHQPHHRGNGTHDEQVSSSEYDASAKTGFGFGLRPCNCPSGCDCQWRHEARAAAVESTKVKVDRSINAFFVAPMPGVTPDAKLSPACPAGSHASAKLTALELCALLCRFIS